MTARLIDRRRMLAGDTQGRRGQPMVNQSTNVVMIETESGLTATSVTALMEMLGDGSRTSDYLPEVYDFEDGKMWPNDRPGLGVEVDRDLLTPIGEYDTYRAGMLMNSRPDGSFINW